MLEAIPTQPLQVRVYRVANHRDAVTFLHEEGIDPEGVLEMIELLTSVNAIESPGELCDAPFKLKPRLRPRTRFSDGSFAVFYCSLEPGTAQAEAQHWFGHFAGRPNGERTALFSCFACDFAGNTKDLRPKQAEWQDLTHVDDYEFCNALGTHAFKEPLDAFLAPSARRPEGTNLPVFARRAVSNPGEQVYMAATYNPYDGKVCLRIE